VYDTYGYGYGYGCSWMDIGWIQWDTVGYSGIQWICYKMAIIIEYR